MEKLTNENLIHTLNNLTVLELIALTKELEEQWGVKAAPPKVEVVQQQSEVQKVAQTEFSVFLASVPADKKMNTIKAIREIMQTGLKESKDFVEAAPKMVKESVSAEEAEAIKVKLTEAGAIVEVK